MFIHRTLHALVEQAEAINLLETMASLHRLLCVPQLKLQKDLLYFVVYIILSAGAKMIYVALHEAIVCKFAPQSCHQDCRCCLLVVVLHPAIFLNLNTATCSLLVLTTTSNIPSGTPLSRVTLADIPLFDEQT